MKPRKLTIPATLAFTILGVGAAGCTGSSNEDCESACAAMNARRFGGCEPVVSSGATTCVSVDEAGTSTPCTYAVVATTSNGACCCQPAV